MKRKFKLYSLFLAGLLAIGLACNKNSLNVPPVNATEADYFKTEAEFDKAVLGVYARLTEGHICSRYIFYLAMM
jgi:hypothetical protein